MGANNECCSPNAQTYDSEAFESEAIQSNLKFMKNLEQMQILEFEERVKQFAFPENLGYINLKQLKEAFKDTDIFVNIENKTSVQHKFYTSTFVKNFPIGSGLDVSIIDKGK